ncbi:hypothetical protein B9Z55_003395 [Caenorhabditis nigoni]|uniref:SET domain-containing protein n=1 Tax=Caenorhabditis nigoni TaxID=1611254 RepID=A0A2G5VQ41_9PELO|nr:hypothetical protein B9Z55_003395 [Caenorhabditis nigoni]
MSSDTDDDASDLKEFDYTAYRNLYTYHAHTLSKTLHRSRESQDILRKFRNLAPKTEIQNFENSEILVASEDVTSSEIVLELNGLDTPLLILTSTGFHGPAYAIRRSAQPNCHLEHVICHLEPIAWILKANKSIPRGAEITVAFDFPPEMGTVDRPRPEVIRRRTVDGYVNVKARERMPPSPTSSESESPDANTTTSGSSESFTSSDFPSVSPRVPMSAPLKRIRTENGWKTLPAKEKILKKSTSSEVPKKKKKKSGGRWGAGWTAKTRKRKVGGAKTTVSPKIRKLDSEPIVTSSETDKTDSNAILTSSDSSIVENSESTSSEAILTSSESSKIVYSILTSSESQKTNSENINPDLTSSEAQKIDNLDFENSEFPKLTSSDSDETQKMEKSVCPRVPMSAPLKRIRTENGWKTLPAKEKKIPPKIDNPQKLINQRKKKRARRQPWSSEGGKKKKKGFALKKKTVVTSSDAPEVEKDDSKDSGAAVTSSNPQEVDKPIVMSSGATATSSEAQKAGIFDSEALPTSSGPPEVEESKVTSPESRNSDSEAPEALSTSSNAPDFGIEDSKDSRVVVTSSNPPEVEKSVVMSSKALATSSETGEFDIAYSGELGAPVTSPEIRYPDSEAPEALFTSSESQNVENHDPGARVTSSENPEVKMLDSDGSEANLTSSEAQKIDNLDMENSEFQKLTSSGSKEPKHERSRKGRMFLHQWVYLSRKYVEIILPTVKKDQSTDQLAQKQVNAVNSLKIALRKQISRFENKKYAAIHPYLEDLVDYALAEGNLNVAVMGIDTLYHVLEEKMTKIRFYIEICRRLQKLSFLAVEEPMKSMLRQANEAIVKHQVVQNQKYQIKWPNGMVEPSLRGLNRELHDFSRSVLKRGVGRPLLGLKTPSEMAEHLDSEPKVPKDSEARILKILENYRISTSSEVSENSPALKIAENSDSQPKILEDSDATTSSEHPEVNILDSEAPEAPSTSSEAPDDEMEDSKDSGNVVTSSGPLEVEKSIVMPSGALATSSETGEFETEYSGEPATPSESQKFKNQDSEVATSSETPEVKIEDSEGPEADLTSSESQKSGNLNCGALEQDLTSFELQNSKNRYSEYPEDVVKIEDDLDVSMEFGEAADLLIFAENEEMSNVTSSGVPEEDSDLATTTSSEISESSVAFLKILENNRIPTSSEAPTSSESFQNLLLTFSPEIPEILDSENVTSSEIRKNLQSTFFPEITENLDSEAPTSSEIPKNSPVLEMAGNLDSEPKGTEASEARILKILENYRLSMSSEIPKNTYSEDVIALLKTSVRKVPKTRKIKNYRAQNLKIPRFRIIQNPEDPEDVKLLALSTVAPGDILLELIGHVALLTEVPEDERSGKWMYTADFLTKNAPESLIGDHRYTKSIFCIDPINECRFLRQSCKPNAHFDHFVDFGNVLHIIVTPTQRIPENSEITLNFDWDFAIDSKESLICALHQFNMSNCPVERQRMRNLVVERDLFHQIKILIDVKCSTNQQINNEHRSQTIT